LHNSYNRGSTTPISAVLLLALLTPSPHGQQRCISPWTASSAGCETGLAITTNRRQKETLWQLLGKAMEKPMRRKTMQNPKKSWRKFTKVFDDMSQV